MESGQFTHVYFRLGTTSHEKQQTVEQILEVSVGKVGQSRHFSCISSVGLSWAPESSCGTVSPHTLSDIQSPWDNQERA